MIQLKYLTTDPSSMEIARKYWAFDPETEEFIYPTAEAAAFFQTNNQRVSNRLAEVCIAFEDSWTCSRCNQPNFTFSSRSNYLEQRRFRSRYPVDSHSYICASCKAELEQIKQQAQADKEAEESRLRRSILDRFRDQAQVVSIDSLSLIEAVFLAAYGRAGLIENQRVLMSLDYVQGQKIRLAPDADIAIEFVKKLYHKNVLQIHSFNTTDIFSGVKNQNEWSFLVNKTNWFYPKSVQIPDKPSSLFQEMEQSFLHSDWPSEWKKEVFPTWKQMALWECLEYLDFTLSEHQLVLKPGEKTLEMLNHLLERYSVSQIYSFIWRASKDAAAFYVREQVTKLHAANTVVGSIQRMAEKAEAEGWEVKGYRRNFHLPQSLMSEVLYNAVLKIGSAGFETKPIEL